MVARSTLLTMATGLGKTVCAGEIAKRWSRGRVLFVAHREELIFQGAKSIGRIVGEDCDIEMADYMADQASLHDRSKVVVASVATLNARRGGEYRMERFDPAEFGLIIVDEAHHSTSDSYRRIFRHFFQNPDCRLLGVTATPDRTDGQALGQVFDEVAYKYSIADGINDGWLVPLNQSFVEVEGLDLSGIRSGKDFTDRQIHEVVKSEEMCHRIAGPTIDLAGDRQTLIFTAGVEQAKRLAEVINRHRPGRAASVDGKTDKIVRRDLIDQFKSGELQYITNCGVFTEGTDLPGIGCVAMARPTKSRSLYVQCVGRGTRPKPGIVDGLNAIELRLEAIANSSKPDCLVLDFVGNSGRHKLVSTADVLGGDKYTLEEIKEAEANFREKQNRGLSPQMQAELQRAREEREARERKRREKIKAKAKYKVSGVSPFDVLDVTPSKENVRWRPPTDKQKQALEKFGVDLAHVRSFDAASKLMDKLIKRAKGNQSSYKQIKLLKKFGIDAGKMTHAEASSQIDRIAKNGWKK